jgi:hypothetical protein
MRHDRRVAKSLLESISAGPLTLMFPAPPKPRPQPTQEGSNKESRYGYQHLWFRPEPTTFTFDGTFTFNGEASHDEGNPDPHVGKIGRQHDEDCSHNPLEHERNRIGNAG